MSDGMTDTALSSDNYESNRVKIRITKIEELSDAETPNNIPEGDTRIGYVSKYNLSPTLRRGYFMETTINKNGLPVKGMHTGFLTSDIVAYTSDPNQKEFLIKTLNSIYKIEVL